MSGKLKKTIIMHIPYCFIGLFATKLGQMWRFTGGAELGERILNLGEGFFAAMENPMPSFHPFDLCVGIAVAVIAKIDTIEPSARKNRATLPEMRAST